MHYENQGLLGPHQLYVSRRNLKMAGVFTLKTHQMFFVHATPKEFENPTINGHFGFGEIT